MAGLGLVGHGRAWLGLAGKAWHGGAGLGGHFLSDFGVVSKQTGVGTPTRFGGHLPGGVLLFPSGDSFTGHQGGFDDHRR